MKKLTLLTIFLMWSLNSFSQVDTTKTCLPNKVLREVAKDLIRYDGCKEELELTNQKLEKVLEREQHKDTIIDLYRRKDDNNEYIIKQQELQIYQYEKMTDDLTKELGNTKTWNTVYKIAAIVGGLLIFVK
jgi:hypothetical protein